jgi:chloramphenicol-sensitive protein RarD
MSKGVLYGLGAYLIWGLFPLYFKALDATPATEILANRIAWSFAFLVILVIWRKEWPRLKTALKQPVTWLIYAGASWLLAVNWLIYIWGVNSDYIVETSLGYFINPLVSVLLGVIFLRERLRPTQWMIIGLATVGVLYLTFTYGRLPWIALALAFTFGTYGLVKKTAPLGSFYSLTLETGILFIPAMLYLLLVHWQGDGAFGQSSALGTLLLIGTGVATSVPLLMFGAAARSINLSVLGILQYVAPTMQFMIGVLVFHEPFTHSQMVGFSIIWTALILFWVEGFMVRQRAKAAAMI